MKVASWNIRRMNDWFTPDDDGPPTFKTNATREKADRVANVIRAIDADVLLIQEGPNRLEEFDLFVREALGGGFDVLGPTGDGTQWLYALVKQNGAVTHSAAVAPAPPIDLSAPFQADTDGDMVPQDASMTREPLVFDVATETGVTRIINLHLKSKHIHRGKSLFQNPDTRQEFIEKALVARRRISAEAFRIRHYLDTLFDKDPLFRVLVAGDLNDGPGSDMFERVYLTHGLVAAIAGSPFQPQRMLRHGFIDRVTPDKAFTSVFDDFVDDIRNRPLMLDHILVSPGLSLHLQDGTIEHEAFEAQVSDGDEPSDHRPASAILDI